jgi:large subunit ribosomal protein L25
VLNVVQHELELNCDAAHIPEEIHVSLEGLEIGDSIHISNIQLPEGSTAAIDDRDFTIATVVAPSVLKAEDEEPAAADEVPTIEGDAEAGETDAEAQPESGER